MKNMLRHGREKKFCAQLPKNISFTKISSSFCCRNSFRHELTVLEKVRHPNVVQFVGAVTQHIPMMIVSELHEEVIAHTFFTMEKIKILTSSVILGWIDVFLFYPFKTHEDLTACIQKKGKLHGQKVLRYGLDIAR